MMDLLKLPTDTWKLSPEEQAALKHYTVKVIRGSKVIESVDCSLYEQALTELDRFSNYGESDTNDTIVLFQGDDNKILRYFKNGKTFVMELTSIKKLI